MKLIKYSYVNLTVFACFLLVIMTMTPSHISANRMAAIELPTQHLLPVSPVHRVIQDSDGYFWYATEGGGLCRDDGYNITVFRSPFPQLSSHFQVVGVNSMTSNHITCLAEGKKKKHIWYGTNQGLFYIDKTDYTVHHVQNLFLNKNKIIEIASTHDGSIWVFVTGKVLRLNPDGELIEHHAVKYQDRNLRLTQFFEDSRHNFYLLFNNNNILQYDFNKRKFIKTAWDSQMEPSHMSEDTANHCYYVGTWGNGLTYFNPLDGSVKSCNYSTPHDDFGRKIIDLLHDNKQKILWVATMNDLYAYRTDRENLEPLPTASNITNNKKVLGLLFQDKDDQIWVPSYTPHTFIITNGDNNITRYAVEAAHRATGFPIIADDVVKNGEYIWIWQGRDNITLYHPNTKRVAYGIEQHDKIFVSRPIENCSFDSGIWAVFDKNILKLTNNDMQIHSEKIGEVPDQNVTALHEAKNSLIIATDKSVYKMHLTEKSLHKICDVHATINKIIDTDNDNLYLATTAGLFLINTDGTHETIIRGIDCSDITNTPDGKLWISTFDGDIFSYDTSAKKLINENKSCILGGEPIKHIESDDSGHIWILTDQFVKEYNPSNKSLRVYHSCNDNIGMDYMHCLYKVSGQEIGIGGIGALCTIASTEELDDSSVSTEVPFVSSVTSGNRFILVGSENHTIEINPDEGECKVTFATSDPLHADHISYAYRLDGLNEEWIYLPQGSNTVYLNHLPIGTYRIIVKATNKYGRWSESSDNIIIRQLPHWYETWWAYLLYFILIVMLTLGSLKLYHRIRQILELHRRQKEVALNAVSINIDEKNMPDFDKKFLEKAVSIVEQNISDCEYNVERFSSDICMSRMSLYRKLHDQTGQTPSEFIRNIRLKRAAQILANSDIPVKDVAAQVGFSTPSYFSKCFKEMFGVLPTQYQNSEQDIAPNHETSITTNVSE